MAVVAFLTKIQKMERDSTNLKNWIKKMEGNSTVPKNCSLTNFLLKSKAELLYVGCFFALNCLPWEFLLKKKLEIEKTKTT